MAARIAENLEEIRRSEYTEWDLIEDWDHQPRKRNRPWLRSTATDERVEVDARVPPACRYM
jgi:hypothetical protein